MAPSFTTTRVADWLALITSTILLALFALFHSKEIRRSQLIIALAITLAFALLGRLTHGVSTSGAIAGALLAFLMAARDLRIFWVLLVVFALTLVATRLGSSRKRQLRIAESGSGRSASQVIGDSRVKDRQRDAAIDTAALRGRVPRNHHAIERHRSVSDGYSASSRAAAIRSRSARRTWSCWSATWC